MSVRMTGQPNERSLLVMYYHIYYCFQKKKSSYYLQRLHDETAEGILTSRRASYSFLRS